MSTHFSIHLSQAITKPLMHSNGYYTESPKIEHIKTKGMIDLSTTHSPTHLLTHLIAHSLTHSLNHSLTRSINPSVDQPINQPPKQPANQPTNQSIHQSLGSRWSRWTATSWPAASSGRAASRGGGSEAPWRACSRPASSSWCAFFKTVLFQNFYIQDQSIELYMGMASSKCSYKHCLVSRRLSNIHCLALKT